MITVRIYIIANSEKEIELKNAIEKLCTEIDKEHGCISCKLFQNTRNPLEYLLIEKWRTMENVKEHVATKNMAVLAGAGVILSHEIRVSLDKGEKVQELNREYMLRLSAREQTR